jgi:Predicted pyridoxal phosphate-dependent enzyme apparently involved in regulation of cell wall biogenesis
MHEVINVTKTHLPAREKLDRYIDRIYDSNWLTNNGPLVQELTARLEATLGVENLLLVSNGTLALQIATKALGITKQAVTTPFSFVATTSSLVWEGIEPIFADIDPKTFCIDPKEIEKGLTPETQAIVPVHVFGNACEIEAIENLAREHGLKTVYDAAHAFGVQYKDKSILNYGDASTLSFHATKIFHTIEGGAIIFKDREVYERARLMINFGINGPDSVVALGINAKMNEFQAAMGLAVLDEMEQIISGRQAVWTQYDSNLKEKLQLQKRNPDCTSNYAYFPVVFESEEALLEAKAELNRNRINPRRYFYPSLDKVPFLRGQECPQSREIASRILCLPINTRLKATIVSQICSLIQKG